MGNDLESAAKVVVRFGRHALEESNLDRDAEAEYLNVKFYCHNRFCF